MPAGYCLRARHNAYDVSLTWMQQYRWENRARTVLTSLLLFLQPPLNGMAN